MFRSYLTIFRKLFSFCSQRTGLDLKEILKFFLDFAHRSVFWNLKKSTIRKFDLFPSSGEGREDTYSVVSLRKS